MEVNRASKEAMTKCQAREQGVARSKTNPFLLGKKGLCIPQRKLRDLSSFAPGALFLVFLNLSIMFCNMTYTIQYQRGLGEPDRVFLTEPFPSIGFVGEYENSVDPKYRIMLPIKFRRLDDEEHILDNGILFAGTRSDIYIVPEGVWDYFSAQNPHFKKAERFIRPLTYEFKLDDYGRITIPEPARPYFPPNQKICVQGKGKFIKISNTQASKN